MSTRLLTLIIPGSSPGQEYHILSPKAVLKDSGTASCPHCQPSRTRDTGKRQRSGRWRLSLSPLGIFIRAESEPFYERRGSETLSNLLKGTQLRSDSASI